jgi:hypothetical protein
MHTSMARKPSRVRAVIYSIVGTCRLLKIDPLAYLIWVLPKLAAATNKTRGGLLPHDYAALHPQQAPCTLNTS